MFGSVWRTSGIFEVENQMAPDWYREIPHRMVWPIMPAVLDWESFFLSVCNEFALNDRHTFPVIDLSLALVY